MIFFLTALVAFAGSMVQSASGFGYAIICMTFWTRFMPFVTASVIEAVTAFFMVSYIALRLRKYIDYKLLLPSLIVSLTFSFFGVKTLMVLSDDVLQKILGIALLLLACYFVFFSSRVHIKATTLNGILAGIVSGFCGGLFNIGGPPIVAYYLSVTEDKNRYNATLQAYFCLTTMGIFLIHVFKGNLTPEMLPMTASALAGTAVGTVLGFLIFKKLNMKSIKKLVYAFMIVAGSYLVFFN